MNIESNSLEKVNRMIYAYRPKINKIVITNAIAETRNKYVLNLTDSLAIEIMYEDTR